MHAHTSQPDLTQWPWPQIIVYVVFCAFLIFGGPGARAVALATLLFRKTVVALARWVTFVPPLLTGDASLVDMQNAASRNDDVALREFRYRIDAIASLIERADATAALHLAVLAGSVGVVAVTIAREPATLFGGATWLLFLAVAGIVVGAIVDLDCLLRDYAYACEAPHADDYLASAMLDDPKLKAQTVSRLVERYASYARRLARVGARKSRSSRVASVCLIAGVLVLLLNAFWVHAHPAPASGDSPVPAGGVHRPL